LTVYFTKICGNEKEDVLKSGFRTSNKFEKIFRDERSLPVYLKELFKRG